MRKDRRLRGAGWGIAALAACAACSSAATYRAYPGPALPASETAALRVVQYREPGAAWNAVIAEVDGKQPPFLFRATEADRNFLFDSPTNATKTVELEPGTHQLRVGLFWDEFLGGGSDGDDGGHCVLEFAAAPGRSYELESDYWRQSFGDWVLRRRDWTAWVVDGATQQVVSTGSCEPG